MVPCTAGLASMTPTIGDAVEYRVMEYRGPEDIREVWVPATITSVNYYQICVQDADHIARAIPRYGEQWRLAAEQA